MTGSKGPLSRQRERAGPAAALVGLFALLLLSVPAFAAEPDVVPMPPPPPPMPLPPPAPVLVPEPPPLRSPNLMDRLRTESYRLDTERHLQQMERQDLDAAGQRELDRLRGNTERLRQR